MKTVTFNRLVSKKELKLHRELADVQNVIEATLGDLEINPLITIDEIGEKLAELVDKYNTIIYREAQELFNSIFDVLENGCDGVEDVRLDVYGRLIDVYYIIEHIKVWTSAPEVIMTKDASQNVSYFLNEHPEAKKLNIQVIR